MLNTNERIIKPKVGLLNLAEELGNVSKDCKVMGLSRDTFYRYKKKLYGSQDELQQDLDDWLEYYNNERTHQGKLCCGRTPMQTLEDGKQIWKEKFVA